jgi:hypothetical protein
LGEIIILRVNKFWIECNNNIIFAPWTIDTLGLAGFRHKNAQANTKQIFVSDNNFNFSYVLLKQKLFISCIYLFHQLIFYLVLQCCLECCCYSCLVTIAFPNWSSNERGCLTESGRTGFTARSAPPIPE